MLHLTQPHCNSPSLKEFMDHRCRNFHSFMFSNSSRNICKVVREEETSGILALRDNNTTGKHISGETKDRGEKRQRREVLQEGSVIACDVSSPV